MVCVELSFEVKGFVFFFLGGVGGGQRSYISGGDWGISHTPLLVLLIVFLFHFFNGHCWLLRPQAVAIWSLFYFLWCLGIWDISIFNLGILSLSSRVVFLNLLSDWVGVLPLSRSLSCSWDLVLVGIGDPNLFLEIGAFHLQGTSCCLVQFEGWNLKVL